jgi:hypothetical protein
MTIHLVRIWAAVKAIDLKIPDSMLLRAAPIDRMKLR